MRAEKRYLTVDRLATHCLQAGADAAPVLVLLHGGAWGESACTAWSPVIDGLADTGLHVVAPDWLGFGESAKVRDFADLPGHMISHLARMLQALGIETAVFVGLSMGGSHLLRALTLGPALPISRLVLVSAGGAPIDKSAGAALMDYDGSDESMRAQIALAGANARVRGDEAYLRARQEEAHRPGAYEWFAALALQAPWAQSRSGDRVPYESISVPTLVLAGAQDTLKPQGFSAEVAARIPDAKHYVFRDAGHCPQLDVPDEFIEQVATFAHS